MDIDIYAEATPPDFPCVDCICLPACYSLFQEFMITDNICVCDDYKISSGFISTLTKKCDVMNSYLRERGDNSFATCIVFMYNFFRVKHLNVMKSKTEERES